MESMLYFFILIMLYLKYIQLENLERLTKIKKKFITL